MLIKIEEIPEELFSLLGEVKEITFPRQGHTSDVGIIKTNRRSFVLKRAKGSRFCSWLTEEVKMLKSLINTNLPVPKVYNFIEQPAMEQSWLVMELLEGVTLRSYLLKETDKEKRNKVIFNYGKVLSQIHSSSCPKFISTDSVWLDDMIKKAAFNFHNYKVDGSLELLHSLQNNRPDPVQQTLIHGDYTIDNVLVKDGYIAGVIDWSGCAFGDPRYDASLAIRPKPNAFQVQSEIDIFFTGYGQRIINDQEYNYFENRLYAFF